MTPRVDVVIGLDIGTTSAKAVVRTATERSAPYVEQPTPWQAGRGGQTEIDPYRLLGLAVDLIGRAVGDRYREDLERAGIGDGRHCFEFAIPDQRIASHNRQVHRFQAVNEFYHPVDQFLAFAIAEAAECCLAAQVIVTVRVTSRTSQGTFTGDLDGQHWGPAAQDASPGGKQFSHGHSRA